MSLWLPLQVLIVISLQLACAEITTEPSYSGENETISETEEPDTVLPSVFNVSNYINECNGDEVNGTRSSCETLEDGSSRETCVEFLDVIENMMKFPCTLSFEDAEVAMNTSTDYLNVCQRRSTCAESVEIVENLMQGLQKCNKTDDLFMDLIGTIQNIKTLQTRIGPLNDSEAWTLIVEEQSKLVTNIRKYIKEVQKMQNYMKEKNITKIFMTYLIDGRTNIPNLQLTLSKQIIYLQYCKENQALWRKIDILRFDVRMIAFLLFFIVGVTGNILLLMVFVRYPDMRTTANIMLINLTVVDCLCLMLNLPLTYLKTTSIWSLGVGECRGFYFIRYITICVSTYSVVMISVQRFLAVTRFPKATGCTMGEKTKSILMLSGVWLLGILYSLPRMIFSEVSMGMCSDVNEEIFGIMTTVDMVMICVVPTLIMAVFSYLTSLKIKQSVSNPTGERTGQEQLRRDRMLSANVLTGLAILFVVSYFPSFLLYFIRFQLDIQLGAFEMYLADTLTYLLQFINSCLNPVALCIMSRKYRKYFQEILSCWRIPIKLHKTPATSDASMSTTESTT